MREANLGVCKFLGFYTIAVEVSIVLGCDAASLGQIAGPIFNV
jgi:hypothetical protein